MRNMRNIRTVFECPECGRVFDISDDEQATEFYFGHDCEVTS